MVKDLMLKKDGLNAWLGKLLHITDAKELGQRLGKVLSQYILNLLTESTLEQSLALCPDAIDRLFQVCDEKGSSTVQTSQLVALANLQLRETSQKWFPLVSTYQETTTQNYNAQAFSWISTVSAFYVFTMHSE